MPVISTVKSRDELKARHAPYWHQLRRGCYLGFRKVSATSAGAWVARFRDDDGKQHLKSLGNFLEVTPSQRFGKAMEAAEQWLKHMGAGGSNEAQTVADACKAYVMTVGATTAKDAEGRFKRWVYGDPIGKIEIQKLRHPNVTKWRQRLVNAPVIRQDRQASKQARSASSINRDMNCLRAALNRALAERWVTTDDAWKSALKPIRAADKRRTIYLSRAQREALIEAAQADIKPFLKALASIPLRPGAVAALTVRDWNPRTKELSISKDKTGARTIRLPDSLIAMFNDAAKNKLPAAPLFSRSDGKEWDKDSWKYPIKAAVVNAKLPHDAVAYSLRHSAITDLLSLHGLDTLTVAGLAGTSLVMIEKHYGHLLRERATDALDRLAI